MNDISNIRNIYLASIQMYPEKLQLHKFHPTTCDMCLQCNQHSGRLLHVLWTCPLLQPFWKEVHSIISQMTTYTLDYSPAEFLLHHMSLSHKTCFKSVAMHMVNAAKLCILLVHWGKTHAPSVSELFTCILKIMEMEELVSVTNDSPF